VHFQAVSDLRHTDWRAAGHKISQFVTILKVTAANWRNCQMVPISLDIIVQDLGLMNRILKIVQSAVPDTQVQLRPTA